MASIEFFFDVSSPWTYLAFHNVQPLAREAGAEIVWRPILVGGVFNAVNPSVYQARETPVPAKQAYQAKDLADWARLAGLTIRYLPSVFPVNSVKAMRALVVAGRDGRTVELAQALFEAYWRDDRDLGDDAVLADVLRQAGFDAAATLEAVQDDTVKQQLRENTDELIRRGGFGSPTLFVDGGDMYFGNDRLPLVWRALLTERAAAG